MINFILGVLLTGTIVALNTHVNNELKRMGIDTCIQGECPEEVKETNQIEKITPTPSPIELKSIVVKDGREDSKIESYIAKKFGKYADKALAIVECESKFDPNALNCKTANDGCDRGLWQFNSKWHPEVSDAEAFNWELSTNHAYRISNGGVDFSQWVCEDLID